MSARTPESIVRILLIGSIVAAAVLLTLLSISHILLSNSYSFSLLSLGTLVLAYLLVCTMALRTGHITFAALCIIAFYYIVALITSLSQGLTSPISLLLYCFFILIGGVLMGSSYIVRNATWSVATLFLLQLLEELKITNTNESISSISAVAAYSVLYGIFAFFGWVAASQIERALDDSLQAKAALLHQKNLLANALASEEYRRQQLQVEELHNIYQFAEIGQQTTLLLHDFANQLTTLSLEIDDPSPAARQHALATIKDINQTMQTVRDTLSNDAGEVVSVTKIVREVVRGYHAKVTSEHIKLHIKTETSQYQAVTYGDGLKLRQIFNILIDNAVHAYASSSKRKARTILVNVKTAQSTVIVSCTDHGAGIPHDQRKLLFSPNHTTKLNGHGIGLYIAKRIIEKQFQGTITLSPKTDFTQFIITLPRIS